MSPYPIFSWRTGLKTHFYRRSDAFGLGGTALHCGTRRVTIYYRYVSAFIRPRRNIFVGIVVISALLIKSAFSVVRAWILMNLRYTLGVKWAEMFFNRLIKLTLSFLRSGTPAISRRASSR